MALKKSQQSLKDWTAQKWRTKSGKPSTQGSEATGERYLPEKAIKAMSSSEYAASTKKKREDTAKGRQHSKQPKKAAETARKYRNTGGIVNKAKFKTVMEEFGAGKLKSSSGDTVTSRDQALAIAYAQSRAAKQMGGLMEAAKKQKPLFRMAEGGSMMVPTERKKHSVGSLVKALVKKLTKEHPNKNVISFSEDELAAARKETGGDEEFLDYLSEFSIVRDQDEAIAKIADEKGVSFEEAEKLHKMRINKADGGSLMIPTEGVPVDTYPNIPPEEMAEAKASQLPDDQMEQGYLEYVITETLAPEEQEYLKNALESDPQLSAIIDKVVLTASEFSGAGEVEGPGTGVSDSIPARLSDGEFVFTKKATDQIGADNLQVMMDEAERAYDGGLMSRPSDATQTALTDEEKIQRQMAGANRMPSIR